MRVLQYNVLTGWDTKNRLSLFSRWMQKQKYDVVGFNELNGWTSDRFQSQAEEWGYKHSCLFEMKSSPFFIGVISKFPIQQIDCMEEPPFHHGLLHVKINSIHFMVTHLTPFDSEDREREANQIGRYIASIQEPVALMGDFNALSPLDRGRYEQNEIVKLFAEHKERSKRQMRNGVIDYKPMDTLLNAGLFDVGFKELLDYSFPTPLEHDSNEKNRRRIDYILVNSALKRREPVAEVIHSREVEGLSDHYPVRCFWE